MSRLVTVKELLQLFLSGLKSAMAYYAKNLLPMEIANPMIPDVGKNVEAFREVEK